MHEQTAGLGRAIQIRRAELGLKRKEVAERALLSYPYLSELENGSKAPSAKALRQLADALELSQAELLARAEASPAGQAHRPVHDQTSANVRFALPATTTSRPEHLERYSDSPTRRVPATSAEDDQVQRFADVMAATVRAELAAWARTELPALIRAEVRRALDEPGSPND